MLKIVFCPILRPLTLTTILTISLWVIFIIVLIVGGVNTYGSLLATDANSMIDF